MHAHAHTHTHTHTQSHAFLKHNRHTPLKRACTCPHTHIQTQERRYTHLHWLHMSTHTHTNTRTQVYTPALTSASWWWSVLTPVPLAASPSLVWQQHTTLHYRHGYTTHTQWHSILTSDAYKDTKNCMKVEPPLVVTSPLQEWGDWLKPYQWPPPLPPLSNWHSNGHTARHLTFQGQY